MATIKFDEISEESRWVFDCPECGECSESCDEPRDTINCEQCGATIEVED